MRITIQLFFYISAVIFGLSFAGTAKAEDTQTLSCHSRNFDLSYCYAKGEIKKAYVERKTSPMQCKYNKTWGYSGNRIWVDNGCKADFIVFTRGTQSHHGQNGFGQGQFGGYENTNHRRSIVCVSNSVRKIYCDVGGRIKNLSLHRQLSSSSCYEGVSWGYSRNQIWVDKGCAAEFIADVNIYPQHNYGNNTDLDIFIETDRDDRYNSNYGTKQRNLLCFSNGFQLKSCKIDGNIETVSIRQNLSDSPCHQGVHWGYSRRKIWVNKGCSAEFLVHYR